MWASANLGDNTEGSICWGLYAEDRKFEAPQVRDHVRGTTNLQDHKWETASGGPRAGAHKFGGPSATPLSIMGVPPRFSRGSPGAHGANSNDAGPADRHNNGSLVVLPGFSR